MINVRKGAKAIKMKIGGVSIAEDIERIEAHLGISALRELVTPYPKDGEEAKFSVGFQVALFLYGFENMPYNYKPEIIMRPEIQDLINRTFYYEEEKYNNLPSEMGVGPADVVVITKDGVEHKKTRNFPVGHLTDPLSDEGVYDKYMTCAKRFLGEEKAEKLLRKNLQHPLCRKVTTLCTRRRPISPLLRREASAPRFPPPRPRSRTPLCVRSPESV